MNDNNNADNESTDERSREHVTETMHVMPVGAVADDAIASNDNSTFTNALAARSA